jgi:hypothetical protein
MKFFSSRNNPANYNLAASGKSARISGKHLIETRT